MSEARNYYIMTIEDAQAAAEFDAIDRTTEQYWHSADTGSFTTLLAPGREYLGLMDKTNKIIMDHILKEGTPQASKTQRELPDKNHFDEDVLVVGNLPDGILLRLDIEALTPKPNKPEEKIYSRNENALGVVQTMLKEGRTYKYVAFRTPEGRFELYPPENIVIGRVNSIVKDFDGIQVPRLERVRKAEILERQSPLQSDLAHQAQPTLTTSSFWNPLKLFKGK